MILLLLGVIVANSIGRFQVGLIAAALSLAVMDFFFLPPLYTFAIDRAAALAFFEFMLTLTVLAWSIMAVTSRHGNSRNSSPPRSARRSDHCVNWSEERGAHILRAVFPHHTRQDRSVSSRREMK